MFLKGGFNEHQEESRRVRSIPILHDSTGKPYLAVLRPPDTRYSPRRVRDFGANGWDEVGGDEDCDSWIIFQPSTPGDDDVYVVYWDKEKGRWLWRAAGYGPFGRAYETLTADMAGVLREYFGLEEGLSSEGLQLTPPHELASGKQGKLTNRPNRTSDTETMPTNRSDEPPR